MNLFEYCKANTQNKIQCIKVVRMATGLGLKESKDLVDSWMAANVVISEGDKADALLPVPWEMMYNEMQKRLSDECNQTVELRRTIYGLNDKIEMLQRAQSPIQPDPELAELKWFVNEIRSDSDGWICVSLEAEKGSADLRSTRGSELFRLWKKLK